MSFVKLSTLLVAGTLLFLQGSSAIPASGGGPASISTFPNIDASDFPVDSLPDCHEHEAAVNPYKNETGTFFCTMKPDNSSDAAKRDTLIEREADVWAGPGCATSSAYLRLTDAQGLCPQLPATVALPASGTTDCYCQSWYVGSATYLACNCNSCFTFAIGNNNNFCNQIIQSCLGPYGQAGFFTNFPLNAAVILTGTGGFVSVPTSQGGC